jgi:hypothetical protein
VADDKADIEGYTEFLRATDDIKRTLPEAMRTAANEMASEWVSAARSAASTAQEQIVGASLLVNSAGEGSEIQSHSPMFYGVEFGGRGRPQTMQFPPFQGARGYFFYQARRDNEERFMEIWGKGVDIAMNPWDRNE